ncbi:MAG: echA8 29 [Pseudonocardiales bacterium]|nr:echA8 29 [Pseudonocardiales bacterium]
MYDLPPELTVTGDGYIRTVTLNRPDKLNAIDGGLHKGLATVWSQLRDDPDAHVVVLTGAGRAFSVGGDIDWFSDIAADDMARYTIMDDARRIVTEMIAFNRPVIAAINGPAIGLGCSLAVMSDIVLMSTSAFMADPHAAVGLVAADGGTLAWPLLTSLLHAKEYLFTGDRIPAETAVQLGLANHVVEPDDLLTRAYALAERLANMPQRALRDTKRAVNLHLSRAVAGVIDFAFAAESETMALRAFVSKDEARR